MSIMGSLLQKLIFVDRGSLIRRWAESLNTVSLDGGVRYHQYVSVLGSMCEIPISNNAFKISACLCSISSIRQAFMLG